MSPRYSLIIFDWDGTLARSLHLWLAGFRESLQAQDHHLSDDVIAQQFLSDVGSIRSRYPTLDTDLAIIHAREYVHLHSHTLDLYPDTHFTLENLNAQLAIVSSSPRTILESSLTHKNLLSYFSSIIAGDDVQQYKPHPEGILTTLARHNVSPHQALIIGDTHTDIAAGKAAGIDTCLFAPDDNALFHDFSHARAHTPHYEIASLRQLLDIQHGTTALV